MAKPKGPKRTRDAQPHVKPGEAPTAAPTHDERAMPRAFWEAAVGKPVESPEVLAVVERLGGEYELRAYEPSTARFDPDIAESVRWEFPNAPKINVYASHFRVRHGICVQLVLSPTLVSDAPIPRRYGGTVIGEPAADVVEYLPHGPEWNWAPSIVRRGEQYLLALDVGQGHWDGTYKFRITPQQAERLKSDKVVYRMLWDALVKIAQGRRFFDNPETLPGDVQAKINELLGAE